LQKTHKQLQQRLTTEETASQATNSKIEELQRALKDAKDALKRETERVAKVEKTVVDLRGKNEDLQKELDDLVKEDTGRNGEVSLPICMSRGDPDFLRAVRQGAPRSQERDQGPQVCREHQGR
jgi:septal ring factor EnvC (AmiA/AmiB activator)